MQIFKLVTYVFFFGYSGLLTIAGAWGIFFAPVDFEYLLNLSLDSASDQSRADTLSQYRFLRAVEFGVGLIFIIKWRHIFNNLEFNRLFLVLISAGVLARVVSMAVEGSPSPIFYFFFITELIGAVLVFAYTRKVGLTKT
jgi:hypothetical protein